MDLPLSSCPGMSEKEARLDDEYTTWREETLDYEGLGQLYCEWWEGVIKRDDSQPVGRFEQYVKDEWERMYR